MVAIFEQLIEVTPIPGGWCVEMCGRLEPILFLSGARAETAARRMAQCVAELGRDARIHVHDRQDLVIGDLHYFGC